MALAAAKGSDGAVGAAGGPDGSGETGAVGADGGPDGSGDSGGHMAVVG